MDHSESRNLLTKASLSLVVCGILICLCYLFVDRPVALWVYNHNLSSIAFFRYMTYIPEIFVVLAPVMIVAVMVKNTFSDINHNWRFYFATSIVVAVTILFKSLLKYLFGRTWPGTWFEDNPSFLRDHVYGFHPFYQGTAYQDFPSGHAAVMMAVMGMVWICYPKMRWFISPLILVVLFSLVAMNYHFVSDVVAGAYLGSIIAMYGAYMGQVGHEKIYIPDET